MRQFSRVGSKLFEPVRIVGGPKSRAIVQRPPDIDRPGVEFNYPNLTCRVHHNSLIHSGQVVHLAGGGYHLVADHSETADWVTLHLFRCDRQVSWKRLSSSTDAVTGVERNTTPTTLGTPWVVWNRMRREFVDLNIRIAQETHMLVTGENMQLGDLVNDMTVKRVSHALGVNVVELQG